MSLVQFIVPEQKSLGTSAGALGFRSAPVREWYIKCLDNSLTRRGCALSGPFVLFYLLEADSVSLSALKFKDEGITT